MTRGRIFAFLAVFVLTTAGLTVLMASNASGDKTGNAPTAGGERAKELVVWGEVSTVDRVVGIFPENFPMPSRVIKVLVKEGEEVKKGQQLMELDSEQLKLKVEEADDAVLIAQSEKAKAESVVRTHDIQVRAYEKEWLAKQSELIAKENEFKEAKRLFELKAKVRNELDAAEAAVQAAQFNLEAAKIKLDGFRKETPTFAIEIANRNIKRYETLKKQAEQARDLTTCKAPADGKIIRSFVSDGANFGPQSREPAFWFLKKGTLIIRAEITQEFANRMGMNKTAEIVDESDSSQTWKGTVTKVGDQFLPKRAGGNTLMDLMPVSDDRVLECHISIDLAPGQVGPKFGQKVRVRVK